MAGPSASSDSECPCPRSRPSPTATGRSQAGKKTEGERDGYSEATGDGSLTGRRVHWTISIWSDRLCPSCLPAFAQCKIFRVANEKLMARLDIQMRLLALDYGVHLEMPYHGHVLP